MTKPISEASTIKAIEKLLAYYNFQDEVQTREQLLDRWLRSYPIDWVRLALIEALYQGRYKSASVEYLLQLWKRRGQTLHRFSREFERLVSHNCPKTFLSLLQAPISPQKQQNSQTFLPTVMDDILTVPDEETSAEQLLVSPGPLPEQSVQEDSVVEANPISADTVQFESLTDELLAEPLAELTVEETSEDWLIQAATDRSNICPSVSHLNSAAPIHCFTPISRPSELYTKLAAMAHTEG